MFLAFYVKAGHPDVHAVREPHKHTIKLENQTEQTNSFTSSDKLTDKQIKVSTQIS